MRWCNCARTTSSARCSTWWASRPSSKHAEQVRIFRTIPGPRTRRVRAARRPAPQHLPQFAETARRNAAAQSASRGLRFAGQITGCEGYVESAAIGLLAGRFAAAERLGDRPLPAAADHRAWRASRPHYRRPYRDDRCRAALVSADERQFRPVPAARAGRRPRTPTASGCAARPRRRQEARDLCPGAQ